MTYRVYAKSPLDSAMLRDKPVWICTECGQEIFAQNIAFAILMRDNRNTDIPCPNPFCKQVDSPLKKRTYK